MLNTLLAIPLAPGDGSPLSDLSTKVLIIIVSLCAILAGVAAAKVFAGSGKGNVKKDMNVGGSVGIGILILVVALSLGGVVAWMSSTLGWFDIGIGQ